MRRDSLLAWKNKKLAETTDAYAHRNARWNMDVKEVDLPQDSANYVLYDRLDDLARKADQDDMRNILCGPLVVVLRRWYARWAHAGRMYMRVLRKKKAKREKRGGRASTMIQAPWFIYLGRMITVALCVVVLLDVSDPNNGRISKSHVLHFLGHAFLLLDMVLNLIATSGLILDLRRWCDMALVTAGAFLLMERYFNAYAVLVWLRMPPMLSFLLKIHAVKTRTLLVIRILLDVLGFTFWLTLGGSTLVCAAAFFSTIVAEDKFSLELYTRWVMNFGKILLLSGWSDVFQRTDYWWIFVLLGTLVFTCALRATLVAMVFVLSDREADEMDAKKNIVPEKGTRMRGVLLDTVQFAPSMTVAQQNKFFSEMISAVQACMLDETEIIRIASTNKALQSLHLAGAEPTMGDYYSLREEIRLAPAECVPMLDIASSIQSRVTYISTTMESVSSDLDQFIERLSKHKPVTRRRFETKSPKQSGSRSGSLSTGSIDRQKKIEKKKRSDGSPVSPKSEANSNQEALSGEETYVHHNSPPGEEACSKSAAGEETCDALDPCEELNDESKFRASTNPNPSNGPKDESNGEHGDQTLSAAGIQEENVVAESSTHTRKSDTCLDRPSEERESEVKEDASAQKRGKQGPMAERDEEQISGRTERGGKQGSEILEGSAAKYKRRVDRE